MISRPYKQAALPAFRSLALAGFMANSLLLALLLLLGRAWMGVSLLSGYALAMLVYGFLYRIVNRGFSPASISVRSYGKSLPANFGLLMVGKLVVVGTAVAVLLCVLHVAALWMLAGLLISQFGVTAAVMRFLKTTSILKTTKGID